MKSITCRIGCTTALAVLLVGVIAQSSALESAAVTSDDLKWVQLPNGLSRAGLAGDDKQSGIYAFRVKFPANFRLQPHFHPDDRIVTVISGTMYIGYGEQFDESKITRLPAGSIYTEPAKLPHFNWAKDGEVVVQIIGNGPTGTTPVKPKP
ncbi:MAG: cupin domain-containing protein [Gammaproteobacteria bacterium]